VGEHYKSITDTEIACFHIWERATFLRTTADNEYVIDHSLDQLQKMMDPGRFFRVNRNCIININQISDIISYPSSRLKILLKTKTPIQEIIVSKDKVSEFKKWIDK
jgi:DNA-binding LytR/AlgR family response regulator